MFRQIHEQLQLEERFPFACFQTEDQQQFLHVHDCLELNWIEHGEGDYIIDGRKYPIRQGDLFVINNEEPHMAVHAEKMQIHVLVFDIGLLWRNEGIRWVLSPFLSRKEQFSHRITGNRRHYAQMVQLFQSISQENEMREPGWQVAVEALLLYLLTLICRCYEEKQELEEQKDFQKMYARIYEVFRYIDEHFNETMTLEQLAGKVSLSPHYLCRCFKKVTGRTIFEYIEQMRIQYSCYLLSTTQDPVTDIALASGFNTVSYFNRIFRRCKGQTPKDYRQKSAVLSGIPPVAAQD